MIKNNKKLEKNCVTLSLIKLLYNDEKFYWIFKIHNNEDIGNNLLETKFKNIFE